MKDQYDFSKGVRGKFYNEDTNSHLPVYLDPDVEKFIRDLARKNNTNAQTIVNDWLKERIKIQVV